MLKSKKGITLVALVITIIVLLILAGVTISIVLNGGLIQQAQNSTGNTSKASALESLQLGVATAKADVLAAATKVGGTPMTTSEVEAVINGEVNADVTLGSASAGTLTSTYSPTYKDGSAMGTITLTLDSDGNVTDVAFAQASTFTW